MTPKEAAKCAKLIGAKHNVPVHMNPVNPYGEKAATQFAASAPNAQLIRPGVPTEL
jgi:L-ascorbate metabolism protein UlaG (beta-lactamase superfamily)